MIDRITAKGLVRSFGRARILREVNASFGAGRVHALVGANGSGKTTFLRVLAGLLGFERGVLEYGPIQIVSGGPMEWPLKRKIAYLGHESFAYPQLSGRENLKFACDLYGSDNKKIEEILDRYQLLRAADRPLSTYSRGMVQRTALARVQIQDPDILLLDEPTTGLDTQTHRIVLEDIRDASAKGRIVIVVSHDPRDLEELGGYLYRIDRGRISLDEANN